VRFREGISSPLSFIQLRNGNALFDLDRHLLNRVRDLPRADPAQLEQQIVALQNRPTPQQIGMLRWYQDISGTNVEIGLPNVSLTFDGLNI